MMLNMTPHVVVDSRSTQQHWLLATAESSDLTNQECVETTVSVESAGVDTSGPKSDASKAFSFLDRLKCPSHSDLSRH